MPSWPKFDRHTGIIRRNVSPQTEIDAQQLSEGAATSVQIGFEVKRYVLGNPHQILSINMGQNNVIQEMVLEKNSLILVDYTARLKDSGEVIESTRAGDAPTPLDPKNRYKPKLVTVGNSAHPVYRGFDAALAGAQIDVPQTVEVAPQDAYGVVNRAQVRMFTLRKLGENMDKVSIGDTLTVDGKQGVVKFIGSGRVRIDFNHRYAGKAILYDFVVTKKLESPTDIIKALLDDAGFVENEDSFRVVDNFLSVYVPSKLFRNKKAQNDKYLLQMEIFQFVPGLEGIEFIDLYHNPIKPKPEPESESGVDFGIPKSVQEP